MQDFGVMQRILLIYQKIKQSNWITSKELQEYLREKLRKDEKKYDFNVRTIKRDIDTLRDNFGFSIDYVCKKGFHLQEDQDTSVEIFETFQEAFSLFNALKTTAGLQEYVFPEYRPNHGTQHIQGLLDAIQKKKSICIDYETYEGEKYEGLVVDPYALKEVRNRWYLLCIKRGENILKSFGLDRIIQFKESRERFKRREIDIDGLYRDYFGILKLPEPEPEEIILAFSQEDGNYVRSQPIHRSQQEIPDPANKDRYVIRLFLQANDEFVRELFARGESMEVLKPQELRQKIYEFHQQGAQRNAPRKSQNRQ